MYDFKNDEDTSSSMGELALKIISSAVRLFGFILMLFGLWVAVMVMLEALELYENPTRIEQLAVHIERGSNIDATLSTTNGPSTVNSDAAKAAMVNAGKDIHVSYFFAWVIAILLLLLIARIALGVIKTGGELVLYDVQIKRFARELIKESYKTSK